MGDLAVVTVGRHDTDIVGNIQVLRQNLVGAQGGDVAETVLLQNVHHFFIRQL